MTLAQRLRAISDSVEIQVSPDGLIRYSEPVTSTSDLIEPELADVDYDDDAMAAWAADIDYDDVDHDDPDGFDYEDR